MLSIRQLQCLPGVNLSYALVNAVGVSEFSEPQEQCFYGERGGTRVGERCIQVNVYKSYVGVCRFMCIGIQLNVSI